MSVRAASCVFAAILTTSCQAPETSAFDASASWVAAPTSAQPVSVMLERADGTAVSSDWLDGQVTIAVFGFTSCPDVCPATLTGMGPALDRLVDAGIPAQGLFIAVDPERDRAGLDAYTAHFSDRIQGATGSPEALQDAADALGGSFRVFDEDGVRQVEHATSAFLIGPDRSVAGYLLRPSSAERVVADVQAWWTGRSAGVAFEDAWVRAPIPGARVTAGYGELRNASDHPLHLLSASSPDASTIQIHETFTDNGLTGMRPADVVIPAGESVRFEPGGLHLMISGVSADTTELPLTLTLSDAVAVRARVPVRAQ